MNPTSLRPQLAKYAILTRNTFSTFMAYRAAFIVWRLQLFISFLVFYYIWYAIGENKQTIGVYSFSALITYFVVGYIVRALVFSTRTADLGGDIQNGNLSQLLLKPIGTIKYYFSRDLIDKLFNMFFMTFEMAIIILMFKPALVMPTWSQFILFCLSVIIATVMFFFYSLLVSFVAFWSESAWPSRFLFGVVFVTLFSGQYIPVDMLPSFLVKLFEWTPYPYFYYYPLRFWLGLESPGAIIEILVRAISLTAVFYFLTIYVWRQGLRRYQSYGN